MSKKKSQQQLQRKPPVTVTGAPSGATTTRQQYAQLSVTYQSPLPPPEILQQYEQVLEGSTTRFLALVEGEAQHRRSMERWLVKGGVLQGYAGMLCGLAIAIFGLYVAWNLGMQGHTWAASVIAALDITSLVSVFVLVGMRGRQSPPADNQQANAQVTSA